MNVSISRETLTRLLNMAYEGCDECGSKDEEDAAVLREAAEILGFRPDDYTWGYLAHHFPHVFKPAMLNLNTYRGRVPVHRLGNRRSPRTASRPETDAEVLARIGDVSPPCCAGYGGCRKPESDPIHIAPNVKR